MFAFETHFGNMPNTVWHTVSNSPSSHNLSGNLVLCSLDKNKKMFPAQVMQKNTLPDNATKMGMLRPIVDRVEQLLVAHEEDSAWPDKATTNKAPVLSAQKKYYHLFGKKSIDLIGTQF